MNDDQLAEDYLQRLSSAAAGLPPGQRDLIVTQTAARIAEARRTGPQRGTALAGVYLHNFLDQQLGDPADLVRASRSRHRAQARGRGGRPAATAPQGQAGTRQVWAVALLLGGGFLAGGGWLAGVALLWSSSRWRISDKVLGTLVWPGGLAGALVAPAVLLLRQISTGPTCSFGSPGPGGIANFAGQACPTGSAGSLPGGLFVTLILVLPLLALLGSTWTAVRLLRRARRAGPAAAPGDRTPVRSEA